MPPTTKAPHAYATYVAIRDILKEQREFMGITQVELAKRVHLSGNTISRTEIGPGAPSLDTLILVLKELELDWLEFWEMVDARLEHPLSANTEKDIE